MATAMGPRDSRNRLVLRTVPGTQENALFLRKHTLQYSWLGDLHRRMQTEDKHAHKCQSKQDKTCGISIPGLGVVPKELKRVFKQKLVREYSQQHHLQWRMVHQQLMWSGHTIGSYLAT